MYKDLLTSTFTQASHDRGIKTWRASASHPHCVFCGNKFRYEAFNVECHMDPNVGGCADTPVHVDAAGNADGKRPCLGNGQTVLMRTPTQAEFVECWSEAIIRNGLPPALVDDPLFRKALVTTSRMGQTAVCMGKGTALGKRDTTLSHRQS